MFFKHEKQRFSIRKFTTGVGSILLGITLMMAVDTQPVYAQFATDTIVEQVTGRTSLRTPGLDFSFQNLGRSWKVETTGNIQQYRDWEYEVVVIQSMERPVIIQRLGEGRISRTDRSLKVEGSSAVKRGKVVIVFKKGRNLRGLYYDRGGDAGFEGDNSTSRMDPQQANITAEGPANNRLEDIGFKENGNALIYYYDVDNQTPVLSEELLLKLRGSTANRTLDGGEKRRAEANPNSTQGLSAFSDGYYTFNNKPVELLDIVGPDSFGGQTFNPTASNNKVDAITIPSGENNQLGAVQVSSPNNAKLITGSTHKWQIRLGSVASSEYKKQGQFNFNTDKNVKNIFLVGYKKEAAKPVVITVSDHTVIEKHPITPIDVPVENVPQGGTTEVTGLPTGVTYNPETGQITGTPSVSDWGQKTKPETTQ